MQRNEDKAATEALKYEVARELGVEAEKIAQHGLTSQEAGRIGGNMVRRMIEEYRRQHGN